MHNGKGLNIVGIWDPLTVETIDERVRAIVRSLTEMLQQRNLIRAQVPLVIEPVH